VLFLESMSVGSLLANIDSLTVYLWGWGVFLETPNRDHETWSVVDGVGLDEAFVV